jgi:beta-N-acetylhexosaminidase
MKRVVKVILLILVTILVIFGAIYYAKNIKKESTATNNTSKNTPTPTPEVSTDLFGKYYEEALKIMAAMSTEEKVGQLFFVRYNSDVTNQIEKYHPAGYILFGVDFKNATKDSIISELSANQKASKLGLAFGVDEEGGAINRVSRYSQFRSAPFGSPQDLYKQGGYDLLASTEKEKDELLLSLGLNINLAPVADVSTNPDDYIYDRSFGADATTTSTYITNMVGYAKSNNISCTLKHFPGYGNNADTHTGIAIDERSYDTFTSSDFLPFEAGIKAGAPTILVSHNVVKCMDANLPASLSSDVHNILRKDLNFTGVIMTDDLAMDAVKAYVNNGEAATLAVEAGNDLIITSDLPTMYTEVLNNVNNKTIDMNTLNQAVKHVIAWKLAYGIIKS